MKIDTLEAYNVPADILRIWRDQVGPELLPVQERAVKEFGLFGDGNLIVFSPTSSGKTFVGEMAAVKAARENTKVFYLVPQKALAAEKYEELRRRYDPVGIKVVVSSRDRREFDQEIEQKEFQIAIVVFEKLQALLVGKPQLMEAVGLVVVDELQMITDRDRGPTLELLLTKLRIAASKPRIIGLSAVLGRAQTLADWLGARLLVDARRPVELRKGVLCRGAFRYREHNTGRESREEFPVFGSNRREDLLLATAEELVRRGEQALVFVPDRATTVQFARVLAQRVQPQAFGSAAEELRQQEETHARELLLEVIGSGIAFHNSDLSPEEREIVERHFRGGAIRALFSTSTLAVGMNLPVKNVVLDHRRWQYLRRYGKWSLEDVSRSEYENMSGRAGRLSLVEDFGRSILVSYSPFEADVWLDHYAGGEFEEIRPTLRDAPLEDHVLDLMASGLATSRADLDEMLLSSFTGAVYWAQKMSRVEFGEALAKAVAIALAGGLLRDLAAGRLEVTDVGRVCAAKGVGVATGAVLASWAVAAKSTGVEELEVLAIAGRTPAGDDVYVGLTKEERNRADYRGSLLARVAVAGVAARPVFAEIANDLASLEYEAIKAHKKVLLLADWIAERRTKDLEATYHVWAGAVRRIGEEYGWIVDALAGIARASGWTDARVAAIEELAQRLTFGVAADGLGVATLRVKGLGRAMVRRLVDAGLRDFASLKAAGREGVAAVLKHKAATAALWAVIERPVAGSPEVVGETRSAAGVADVHDPDVEPPARPTLTVDLREHRVTYRGIEIPTRPPHNLQRQPFLALAVLASRPGQVVGLVDLAAEMSRLGANGRRILTPEGRDLRYKLLAPFRRALGTRVPKTEIDHLVETVSSSGLRLNSPGAVSVVRPAELDGTQASL